MRDGTVFFLIILWGLFTSSFFFYVMYKFIIFSALYSDLVDIYRAKRRHVDVSKLMLRVFLLIFGLALLFAFQQYLIYDGSVVLRWPVMLEPYQSPPEVVESIQRPVEVSYPEAVSESDLDGVLSFCSGVVLGLAWIVFFGK